jgi:hypothetical protein
MHWLWVSDDNQQARKTGERIFFGRILIDRKYYFLQLKIGGHLGKCTQRDIKILYFSVPGQGVEKQLSKKVI